MRKLNRITGIYRIINTANQKVYIGSTARDFIDRWRDHKKRLRRNKHSNLHLQHAWNKYGENSFLFEALEECSKTDCLIREQFYLDTVKPEYNICKVAGNTLGQNCEDFMTDEAIAIKRKRQSLKISQALKNVKKTPEHAANCGAKYFKVFKAVCVQFRKRGQASIYQKGECVGMWLKRSDCIRDLNIQGHNIGFKINRVLKGARSQSHGYIFEYVEAP